MIRFSSLRGSPMMAARSWFLSVLGALPEQVVVVALARRPLRRDGGAVELGDLADQHPGLVGRVTTGRRAVEAVQLEAGRARVLQLVPDPVERQGDQCRVDQLLGGGEGGLLEGDVVVDELAEVGVDGRDLAVAGRRPGVDHRPAQLLQPLDGVRRPGQQVRRVVLEPGEQEVEVLQIQRGRDREPECDLGGAVASASWASRSWSGVADDPCATRGIAEGSHTPQAPAMLALVSVREPAAAAAARPPG